MKFCVLFVSQTGILKRFWLKLFRAIPAASTCPISTGIDYTVDIWSYLTALVIPGLINRPLSVMLRSEGMSTSARVVRDGWLVTILIVQIIGFTCKITKYWQVWPALKLRQLAELFCAYHQFRLCWFILAHPCVYQFREICNVGYFLL